MHRAADPRSRPVATSQFGLHPGVGAALLFRAGTPLAKLLLEGTSPWLMAGLLYLGSGLGLTLSRLLRRSERRARLAPGEWPWCSMSHGGNRTRVADLSALTHVSIEVNRCARVDEH